MLRSIARNHIAALFKGILMGHRKIVFHIVNPKALYATVSGKIVPLFFRTGVDKQIENSLHCPIPIGRHQLRMPLDADHEFVGFLLDLLNNTVCGSSADPKTGGDTVNRLMVEAVDPHRIPQQTVQTTLCPDMYRVAGSIWSGLLKMLECRGSALERNILIQRAAKGHIEGLYASADTQNGAMKPGSVSDGAEVGVIPLRAEETLLQRRFFPILQRIDVDAAGDNQTVHRLYGGHHHLVVPRQRYHQRYPAGTDDRYHIGVAHIKPLAAFRPASFL